MQLYQCHFELVLSLFFDVYRPKAGTAPFSSSRSIRCCGSKDADARVRFTPLF